MKKKFNQKKINSISKSQMNIENNINKILEIFNKINIPNIINDLNSIKKDKETFFDTPNFICEQNN